MMPRVLSAAEFAGKESGIGWLENSFQWDDKDLERFAWVKHSAAGEDGCYIKEQLMEIYNKPDGVRVWVGAFPPTDEQREATPWEATP